MNSRAKLALLLTMFMLWGQPSLADEPSSSPVTGMSTGTPISLTELKELARRDPTATIQQGNLLLDTPLSAVDAANVKVAVAWAYMLQGQYPRSALLTEQALMVAEQHNLPRLRVEAINLEGALAFRQGRFEQAEVYFHKTLAIADQHKYLDRQVSAHSNLGSVYRSLGEPVLALDNLYKALNYSYQLNDPWRTGVTEVNLGLIYKDNAQFNNALNRFNNALASFAKANNELAAVYPLGYISEVYQTQGKYHEALDTALKTHAIWQRHQEKDAVARSHLNLAKLQRLLKRKDLAQSHLDSAKSGYQQLNNSNGIANVLMESGELALDHEQYQKAQQHFRQALSLYQAEDQRNAQLESLLAIAESWLLRNQPKQAESFLKRANNDTLKNAPPTLQLKTDLLKARSRLLLGRLTSAQTFAQSAAALAEQLELLEEASQSYQLLTDIYQQQNRFKDAFFAHKTADNYTNQLAQQNQNTNLQLLRAEHQLSVQSEQLAQLKSGKLQAELALAQQDWQKKSLQATIAVLCILLCLISALVYQSRRLAKAYEDQSEHDPLTKLGNRRFLQHWLSIQIPIMRRRWFQRRSSIYSSADIYFFMIDLDFFKEVNDKHGHSAGDEVLVQFSRLCTKLLRDSDQLVRMGGEEFLLVAQQIDEYGAAQLAEKIRRVVARHSFIVADNQPISITCSLGFAPFPLAEQEPDEAMIEPAIMLSDRLLYEAKAKYRNAWLGLGTSKSWQSRELMDADIDELYAALHRNEVQLHSSHPLPTEAEIEADTDADTGKESPRTRRNASPAAKTNTVAPIKKSDSTS
ncbi:diguanylate cyclase [Corallincola spongiicola]|uniref:diguanylate cyclase n=1 Tax=Corallincola spongiicola TaxID=2520508 RepID=A0ABY1WM95_9GAMM|nr:diguanylate cyclase [Corallincola spongiicola]TAA42711.1 diguanylate cyclase [Corallincola spongiicola]